MTGEAHGAVVTDPAVNTQEREGVLHCRVQRHDRTRNTSDGNARFRNAETCAKGGGEAVIPVFSL